MKPTIVVGVDGSGHSVAALRWAIDHATALQSGVRAVHVYTWPPPGVIDGSLLATWTPEQAQDSARATLHNAVDLAMEGRQPAVPVHEVIIESASISTALEAEARDATLLVVGSHGRNAFQRALLGSVSSAVVHHSHCPVVVVPHAAEPSDDREGSDSEPAGAAS